jgi:hypothetical protein
MKTTLISLIGNPVENFYQLGMSEKEAFKIIEERVKNLVLTNDLIHFGMDLLSKAKMIFRKKEDGLFDQCVSSYAQGLGVEPSRYKSFIVLFELAAHYGQSFPELKGILPGCTSVFQKKDNDYSHSRLVDFPLIGVFDLCPRLYLWQAEGEETILTYSCQGLAPLFLQGIHGCGVSFAVHHKPGKSFHEKGQSIFQIMLESLFETKTFNELRKELKKKTSMTKWSILLLDQTGAVHVTDIDGPAQDNESYNLNDTSPLIFTNIPLQKDSEGFESFFKFSENRQTWLKEKLLHAGQAHILDVMTDIEDQKNRNWIHPSATLSTVGAWHINLTQGYVDIKEGESALTSSDALLRMNLADYKEIKLLREKTREKTMELAWKRAALAQSAFDQRNYENAYHELQMAQTLMTHPVWKEIMSFYLCVFDFIFIENLKELSLVYKNLKKLKVPDILIDQWKLLIMRMEKKLNLSPTVFFKDVSPSFQDLFQQENLAPKAVFATWMKLLYPRMEILDVFSPHG